MMILSQVLAIDFDNITAISFHAKQNIERKPRRNEQKRISNRNYGNNSASEASTRHKPRQDSKSKLHGWETPSFKTEVMVSSEKVGQYPYTSEKINYHLLLKGWIKIYFKSKYSKGYK